jgi:predicted lipid-binding transport protein (Tim44 family)
MSRAIFLLAVALAMLAVSAPAAISQAGGGSSRFGGGGGGGGGSFGGGGSRGGGSRVGGGESGGGAAGDFHDGAWEFVRATLGIFFVLMAVTAVVGAAIVWRSFGRGARERKARDARVGAASAEAAEDDPAFAADAVKAEAARLYHDIQAAWSARDDAALEPLLGADLLVEWRRRLADFAAKGWVNEVAIRRGPQVDYVGLVNREGTGEDRVTVAISACLLSIVRTSSGAIFTRDDDHDGDGEIEICEYWTLARVGDGWRLESIEQEEEGAHHLDAPIVTAPWSDDARLSDQSLVELATADAPPLATSVSELVSVEFDGTAREKALDLALADPRCAPDVLEAAARRAVDAWAEAVDGDDAALLELATPRAAAQLLYAGGSSSSRMRLVVRGPRLLRLWITALNTDGDPPRMHVEVLLAGRCYVEDRDTAAVLSGDKDHETQLTERWTFALDSSPSTPWRLVAGSPA